MWEPDPDSIARPGGFKDPRFNKDPYAEEKRAALKREMQFQGYRSQASSTATPLTGATAVRPPVGSWPAQPVRLAGVMAHPIVSPRISIKEASSKSLADTPGLRLTQLDGPTSPRPSVVKSPKHNIAKSMMEELPIICMSPRRMSTPVDIRSSMVAIPPEKSSLPAWAGPLERALGEDTSQTQLIAGQPSSACYIPPHLRKRVGRLTPEMLQRNALYFAKSSSTSLDAQFEQACETTCRVSNPKSSEILPDGVPSLRHAAQVSLLANNLLPLGSDM